MNAKIKKNKPKEFNEPIQSKLILNISFLLFSINFNFSTIQTNQHTQSQASAGADAKVS